MFSKIQLRKRRVCSKAITDENKNSHRIDAHWLEESSPKIRDIYLDQKPRNPHSSKKIQTDIWDCRVASLLKLDVIYLEYSMPKCVEC